MKALSYTFSFGLLMGCICLASQAPAEIIGADDFSESDGTLLNGKPADVGANWVSPGGVINGGAFDTAQFGGAHQENRVDFTRALGPNERLVLTFETLATGGAMFTPNNNYAGISLYEAGSEKIFIGDPAGGSDAVGTGWTLDGFAGGSGVVISALVNAEAVTGVFTYEYETGNASLVVTDGTNSDTLTRTYDPGLALDRLRIQAGDGAAEINVSSFNASVVPEPSSVALAAMAGFGLAMRGRRRS